MIVMAGEKIKYGLKAKQIDEILERSKMINRLSDSKGQISDTKYTLLLNYFNAWKDSFNKVWFKDNNTLTKISGFRFICFLFPSIYDILTIDRKNDFRLLTIKKIIAEVKNDYFNDEFNIKKTDHFQSFQEKSGTIKLAENIGKQMHEQHKDKQEDFLV